MADTRGDYQRLFDVYWPIGVGVFAIVLALLAFIVIRFRSRSEELPEGRDESKPAEGLYALGLACVAALLTFLTFSAMADQEDVTEPSGAVAADALQVEVTAAKWNWSFDYPEAGVTQEGSDEVPATLVVPAGRPVEFTMSALDVIHSFWIPDLRFKRDAFPDRETTFALTFPEPGFHQGGGECAEYCGLRHSYMSFNVDVREPQDFQRWLAREAAPDEPLAETAP